MLMTEEKLFGENRPMVHRNTQQELPTNLTAVVSIFECS